MAIKDVQYRIAAAQAAFNPFAAIADAGDACWRGGEGALAGVVTSAKDILDVSGFPTRRGSRLGADSAPAAQDIAAVARLRAAGACIVAKTTTTEFAHSPLGYAPLEGMTRNPWNPSRTCGGSSSGAGVAVATGATPLALATDAGCSTRLPAALTGVFGLKPTLGRIPHERLAESFANIVHLGVIAARVDLLKRAFIVLAGPHPDDALSLGHDNRGHDNRSDACLADPATGFAGRRILMWLTIGNQVLHPMVAALMRDVGDRLTRLRAELVEAECPLPNPTPDWQILQRTSWAERFAGLAAERRALLSTSFNAGIDAGAAYSAVDLARALAARTAAFRAIQRIFAAGHDFIMTPCASAPAVAADHPVDAPLEIGGRSVGTLREAWIPSLSLFDLSGHPALTLPAGFDDAGVPMGIQIVAPWGREDRLLAAASAWETAFPFPSLAEDWLKTG